MSEAAVLNALSIGVVILNDATEVVIWNDWMQSRSQLKRDHVIGQPLGTLFAELEHSRLLRACEQALQMNLSSLLSSTLHRSPLPLFMDDKQNKRIDQAITVRPLKFDDKKHCLIEIHDVSAINQKEQVLRQQALTLSWQATHDALTGLANRVLLTQTLEEHLTQARNSHHRHSLLLLDLDKFKHVNDTGGHLAGDDVLKQVAEILRTTVRGGDMPARLGGDEFAVFLPYCDADNAQVVGMQICTRINEHDFRFQQTSYRIGASAGLCFIDATLHNGSEILSRADQALYNAKAAGGNAVFNFSATSSHY